MNENSEHIIESQQYHIAMDKEEDAHQVQSNISLLQGSRINSLLDNILSKFSTADNTFQFNRIELDLGTISKTNYENELVYRLEEQLNNFFNTNILDDGTVITGKSIVRHDRKLEQFEYFLENGHLKWDSSSGQSPSVLLKELISENNSGLVELLNKKGKNERVRKRMIYQFEEASLEHIVKAVAKTESDYIITYNRNMLQHQHKHQAVDTGYSSFRNAVWEVILAYLFVESKSYYNKKSFLNYLIRKIAEKYNLSYHALLEAIAIGVETAPQEANQVEFKKIIVALSKAAIESLKEPKPPLKKEAIVKWIAELNHYLKFGTFRPGFQIASKESFGRQVEEMLQSKNQLVIHQITNWLTVPLNKTKWLTLVSDKVLNQMMTLVKVSFITQGVAFFDEIEKSRSILSLGSRALLRVIATKKARLILGAYTTDQYVEKEVLPRLLMRLKEEFIQKEAAFFVLLNEVLSQLSAKHREAITQFVATTSHHSISDNGSKANKKVLAEIVEVINNFTKDNEIELWHYWLNQNMVNWEQVTGLKKYELLDQIKRQLVKNTSTPQVISFIEKIEKSSASGQEDSFADQNWELENNPSAKKRANKFQKQESLANKGEINRIVLAQINNDLAAILKDKGHIIAWKDDVFQYLSNVSAKYKVSINDVLETLISSIEQDSEKVIMYEQLINFRGSNSYKESKESTELKISDALMALLIMDIQEVFAKNTLFSEWSRALLLNLQKVGGKYKVAIHVIIENVIRHIKKDSAKKQVYEQLIKFSTSEIYIATVNKVADKKTKLQQQENIYYVLEKGILPWWMDNYTWNSFNNDFIELWTSSTNQKQELVAQIKKTGQNISLPDLLNEINLKLVWDSLDLSTNKIHTTLIVEVHQLLKIQLVPLGIVSYQEYKEFNDQVSILMLKGAVGEIEKLLLVYIQQWVEAVALTKNESVAQLLVGILKKTESISSSNTIKKELSSWINTYSKAKTNEVLGLEATNLIHDYWLNKRGEKNTQSKSISTEILRKLEQITVASPNQFKALLIESNFRESLVNDLEDKEIINLIQLNLNANQQRFWVEALAVLEYSSFFISSKELDTIKKQFFYLMLLKLSTGGFASWTIETWSTLMNDCVTNVLGESKKDEVLLKASGKLLSIKGDQYKKGIVLLDQMHRKTIERMDTKNNEMVKKVEDKDYKKLGETKKRELLDPIFIKNAGLIILSPYLGLLFQKCGLTDSEGFIDEESKFKAVHLLEYAATGNTGKEEHELVINKLLCGMDVTEPVERNVTLTDGDKETVNGLLSAITQQWTPLKGTSIDGLRTSFLQRDGKLEEEEEQYFLKIEQKAFDMLLDQIPWNISQIKLSWMEKILLIEWR